MIRNVMARSVAVSLVLAAVNCSSAPALTDHDTILIADVVNSTGDVALDDAVKPAVLVALQQTPFLSVLSDPRVMRALRQMQKAPDEAVAGEMARNLCKQAGAKAVVQGSIAASGSAFIVALDAENCETGASLAKAQAHANNKDEIVSKIGEAAKALRGRLGEPSATLAKFDAPLAKATSAIPEALGDYGRGLRARAMRGDDAAAPFFQQAFARDPAFGIAAAKMAVVLSNVGNVEGARQFTQHAYDLRESMTEYERLYIAWNYAARVQNDQKAVKAALEQLTTTYPRDFGARNNFGVYYNNTSELEEALKQYRAASDIAPDEPGPLSNSAYVLLMLGRYDEASDLVDRALAIRPDANLAIGRWIAARVAGVPRAGEFEAAARKLAGPDQMALAEASLAAWFGQFRAFEKTQDAQIARAKAGGNTDLANGVTIGKTITLAAYRQGRDLEALKAAAMREQEPAFLVQQLSVLAMFGDTAVVEAGLKRLAAKKENEKLGPPLTVARAYMSAKAGRTAEGIAALQATLAEVPRARDLNFFIADLRDRTGDVDGAIAGYRAVIGSLTYLGANPLIPESRLRLAKILLKKGDTAAAKEQLDVLLLQWKDADGEFPALTEAKKLRATIK
jgi:tetratricopeptide (TPR) repeat protein